MMQDILSGDDANKVFDLRVNGFPVTPDSNTTKFTVFDVTGAPVAGLTNVSATLIGGGTQALVNIPGVNNVLGGSSPITRFVRLQFAKDGVVYRETDNYRILPFIPLTVTPEYIRDTIMGGTGPTTYDIYAAYLEAKGRVPTLDAELTGDNAVLANRLVALFAARPSTQRIMLTMKQREKSHDEEVEFYRGIDFTKLLTALDNEIFTIITQLNGAIIEPLPAMILTTRTDPVTGE